MWQVGKNNSVIVKCMLLLNFMKFLDWNENNIDINLFITVCYKMVLDIAWFEDGFEKCIHYIMCENKTQDQIFQAGYIKTRD